MRLRDGDNGYDLADNQRSFDQDYRITDVEITAAGPLHDLGYGYSVVDNVTSLTDQVNGSLTQTFGCDLLDRLTDADGGYGDQSYVSRRRGMRTTSLSQPIEPITLTPRCAHKE